MRDFPDMVSPPPTPPAAFAKKVIYPDDDGLPMCKNTIQYRYITLLKSGFSSLFAGRDDVFVAGNHLWYPVEGNPAIRRAPDVLIAFGRPGGDRGSYKQWEEGGIAPQVVWEVLSPSNRGAEVVRKFLFYEEYRVEEFYQYDPDTGEFSGWVRQDGKLVEIPDLGQWVSPRCGVTFRLHEGLLDVIRPDGRRFESDEELWARAESEREQLRNERERAEQERQRAEALAAKLRSLGIDPGSV